MKRLTLEEIEKLPKEIGVEVNRKDDFMNYAKVREMVEYHASEICSDACAPASHLPEKVVDWITRDFIETYVDDNENLVPDYNNVLNGMCAYLQQECS